MLLPDPSVIYPLHLFEGVVQEFCDNIIHINVHNLSDSGSTLVHYNGFLS